MCDPHDRHGAVPLSLHVAAAVHNGLIACGRHPFSTAAGMLAAVACSTTACRLWNLGVGNALRRLTQSPHVRAILQRADHRTWHDGASMWGSQAMKELNLDCAYVFDEETNRVIAVSIGADAVNAVSWGSRSVTIVLLKLEDLPPHLASKAAAVAPVFVIQGRLEPSYMKYVWKLLVAFFKKHAPSKTGERAPCALICVAVEARPLSSLRCVFDNSLRSVQAPSHAAKCLLKCSPHILSLFFTAIGGRRR